MGRYKDYDKKDEEKFLFKQAQKLLKGKKFTEAKEIYEEILSKRWAAKNTLPVDFTSKDKHRIVACSLGKAKCHHHLEEYGESITTMKKCVSIMTESSKYNSVQLYHRLAAAYLMQLQYRATLLVCVYGLTKFHDDEKLLAINEYIGER